MRRNFEKLICPPSCLELQLADAVQYVSGHVRLLSHAQDGRLLEASYLHGTPSLELQLCPRLILPRSSVSVSVQ